MMKGAFAILAAFLCLMAVSAAAIPQQANVAVGAQGAAVANRKLLGGDDYNYDWKPYSTSDDEVYKAANFALKVVSRSKHLLRALFGDYYQEGYECVYTEVVKAFYFEDYYHNKFFLLTITFEYYGESYTFEFVVLTTYSHYHHHYSPEYLNKIIYNNRYITGKWRE